MGEIITKLPDLIVGGIIFAIPIIIAACGGLFSERSGIVNIGLEGMMTVGAFICATFVSLTGLGFNITFFSAVLLGGVVGLLFSWLHVWATIKQHSDHVISGIALNMIALATTLYMTEVIFGRKETTLMTQLSTKNLLIFPELSKEHQLLEIITYPFIIMLLVVFFTWFIIYQTGFGLKLRSCGENPLAADSVGINVNNIRVKAVLVSGFLSGVSGALIIFLWSKQFTAGTVSGLGFIALGTLVFGKWKPLNVFLIGIFFGIFTSFGNVGAVMFPDFPLPSELFNMVPFIFTILALIIFSRGDVGPKAAGKNFIKEN